MFLATQKEIGNNIEVITKCEVLVDGLDTQAGSDLRTGDLDWLALDEISPESAGPTPAIVLIRVDLPAPLSPTSPTTSPG